MANDKRKCALKRGLTPLAAVALLAALIVSVCGTLAWLTTRTQAITNTFTPAAPSIVVEETFGNQTKSDVKIKNTGEVNSYIRVALIPTWQDDKGNPVGVPASLSDLNITLNETDWLNIGDYYYCKTAIVPSEKTPVLIQTATVKTPNGYHMNLQILADAIQAEPNDAVTDTWGITLDSSGTIIGQGGSAP